jgi:hypothetical protein
MLYANKAAKWSQIHVLSNAELLRQPSILSWGSSEELLVGGSSLVLWSRSESDSPAQIWSQKLSSPAKLALFAHDAGLIASIGHYDRLVKIWRRLSFEAYNVRFDTSYLPHPTTVTHLHWRKPWHAEQNLENLLYTICADNKIRIWTHSDPHALSTMGLLQQIDMNDSIQPRRLSVGSLSDRRYGFIIDSRDFSMATEKAVQSGPTNGSEHALEHLIEIANRSPEICVVLDGRGHMSAWGLENAGYKNKKPASMFNIAHVEGMNISFGKQSNSDEDYAQFCVFAGGSSASCLTILVHYYDGRINWFDAQITQLFDTSPITERVYFKASWSGHDAPVKKIIRSVSGSTAMSRTDDNHGIIWHKKAGETGPVLIRQSSLESKDHIRRSCVIAGGRFVVNLHLGRISLWDTQSLRATEIGSCSFSVESKPLCLLQLPSEHKSVYMAIVCADMTGLAWQLDLQSLMENENSQTNGHHPVIRYFCKFKIDLSDALAFIMPVDPAGSQVQASSYLDIFAPDIALSFSATGVLNMFTAKLDPLERSVEWLATSTVETGIINPSLASGSSIRKAAMVDQHRTSLTIWDTSGAQLEFEERFSESEVIQDLDWTSTPDDQSILAVGFQHRVLLLSQLRYNYLNEQPAWCAIHEIRIRGLSAHPIGDSCWLGNGHLIIGAGNQLFVYDKNIEVLDEALSELRLPSKRTQTMDLFQIVRHLNGSLPVFHPQFLGQCVLSGKMDLVHKILLRLHQKLKFWVDGDEISSFLDLPLHLFFTEVEPLSKATSKEMRSSYAEFVIEEDEQSVTEAVAILLNENLSKVTLSQISSREQFYLADIVECVASVEKHRRSLDENAARYLLFFRQHLLRKSRVLDERAYISWREIVWAFHSDSQDILIDLVSRSYQGKMLWAHARESGMFMWLTDTNALRAQLEVIARNEYTKRDDRSPLDCSLYYLALKKKSVLQGLWRMHYSREQAATLKLLANNFSENRWKTTARKNAYALLSKRRFEYAAAFFLLGDSLSDAVNICVHQLQDLPLAITIARAYGGDDSPVLHRLIVDKVLPEAAETGNRWMATWAFWMMNRRDKAVRSLIYPVNTLLEDSPNSSKSNSPVRNFLQAKSYLSNDPALVVLYRRLREKTVQTLKGALTINPREEWNFIMQNARLYSRMGCDLLALDLTRNWEFLLPSPAPAKRLSLDPAILDDPRKLLRRRSSLVVDDIQHALRGARVAQSPGVKAGDDPFKMHKATEGAKKPPPTVFEEPDASSLLDSFGF